MPVLVGGRVSVCPRLPGIWAWRHGREDGARHSSDKLSLVPVVVRPEVSTRVLSRLEVDFGDGTRLQATGISADDLARAIQALRRPA